MLRVKKSARFPNLVIFRVKRIVARFTLSFGGISVSRIRFGKFSARRRAPARPADAIKSPTATGLILFLSKVAAFEIARC